MFQLLFRYPAPVFSRGQFVLLSAWPRWLLLMLAIAVTSFLATSIFFRVRRLPAQSKLRGWLSGVIWFMQALTVVLLLLLVWQPAIRVAELTSQQNIIAVIVDDSHSMATADVKGKTGGDMSRLTAAVDALRGGMLAGLNNRFQTRLYRLDAGLARMNSNSNDALDHLTATGTATHIGAGLRQLATETSDLPVGAVVLLTDGGENTGGMGGSGIALDALEALRNRRLPVHVIGLGDTSPSRDVEMEDVSAPASAVAQARVQATASFVSHGLTGQHASLTVRNGDSLVASRDVVLAADGAVQTEPIPFPAGAAGARTLRFAIEPIAGETNTRNNALTRPVLVSDAKRRILYIEGEPRWEYKFVRRAEDSDPTVEIVSMLRTSENKIYRQGLRDPNELADGFPTRAEDLFGYSGIIIGSVDADYFSPLQQQLLREYVDRRGGGILFLGGRSSLSDGGWAASSLNDVMPTFLPPGRSSFHRNPATVELTRAGQDSPITRLLDDPQKNAARWKAFTYLADYEDPGSPKPGATVLAQMNANRHQLPLLVTQSFGHGRTAVLATGGTWRWQMSEALGDPSHDLFWQQLVRWLVADTPGQVAASMPERTLLDDGHVHLAALVHDAQFQPAAGAHVSAHISGPAGVSAMVDLSPMPDTPGLYSADWTAEKAGPYLAEITASGAQSRGQDTNLGSDVVTFERQDGVAEAFHTAQNRPLLEQLAANTGGRYWQPSDLKNLPRDISYSEAGISVRSTKPLWNLPIVVLVLLALPLVEWLLRRRWGIV